MNDLDLHIPLVVTDSTPESATPELHSFAAAFADSPSSSDPLTHLSSTLARHDDETVAPASDFPPVITVHFPTTPADLLAPILRIVPFAQTLADRHFAAHANGTLSTAAPTARLTPDSINALNTVASLFLFIVGRILSIRMTFDALVAAHARALRHPYRIRRAQHLAHPMPELLNTAGLADLAASLHPLERDLYDLFDAWASIPGYVPPDETLRDALNFLCTLTSIRKTLWRVATGEIDLTTGLLRTLHADVAAATADAPSFAPDPDDRSSITVCPSIPLYKIPPIDLLKLRLALMIACASGDDDSVMRHIADAPNRHARAAERHAATIDDAYDYLAARRAARTPDRTSDIDPSVRLTADELASTPFASPQDFPDSFPSLSPFHPPNPPPGAA